MRKRSLLKSLSSVKLLDEYHSIIEAVFINEALASTPMEYLLRHFIEEWLVIDRVWKPVRSTLADRHPPTTL